VSPLLKRPFPPEDSQKDALLEKKARLTVAQPPRAPLSNELSRTPLLKLDVPNYCPQGRPPQQEAYFNVLWRNQTTKKNKTWDGDGVLTLEEGCVTLRDSDGKKYGIEMYI
jgi:DNA repair and recombination protein RAD54B